MTTELNQLARAQKGQQSVLLGILANLGLVIVKGLAGWFGNSYALLADAIESATDVFTSRVVWYGLKTASRPPDANHPYGHGKAEPLAAAFFLLATAIVIAVQSWAQIQTPHQVPASFTLLVLAGVVGTKELLFRLMRRVGTQVESSAVQADAWHHRSDALTSLTAFIGISIALWGGKGYESADDWAALIASAIIVYNAFRIFKPAFAEMMDEAPQGDWQREIRSIAFATPGVKDIDKCYVRKMGLHYFVDLHLLVDGHMSVSKGHHIAHQVKRAVIVAKPSIHDVLIHVEPFDHA